MNGAQIIIEQLQDRGITQIFGYPGGCIMPFYDALVDSTLQHILCRHEQGVALAANGYARASGKPGVCVATSGPGATNLITGVADAFADSIPMVIITGQVGSNMMGTDAFQEIDVLGLTLGITKHSYLVTDINKLEQTLSQAFELATCGRPGPVWIDIPKDIFLAKPAGRYQPGQKPTQTPEANNIAHAEQLLRAAHRPIICSGGGVIAADAIDEFRTFINLLQIPQAVTLKGIGNSGKSYGLNMGMLGMHGSRACNEMIEGCDLLIAVGIRFDDRATGTVEHFAPNARIIHMDIDPSEFHKNKVVDCPVRGDLKLTLKNLTEKFSEALSIQPWRNHCINMNNQKGLRTLPLSGKTETILGPDLLAHLSANTDHNTIISCDVGQHQMWVAQYVDFDHPRQHLSSGGLGTMGFGLPAAIGAKCACPDATVINISGDGSFMMNLQELATIKRQQLDIKIIILDNQHLGLVRQQQELFYQGRYNAVDLSDNPDFAELARAFGFYTQTIHSRQQIPAAIESLLAATGPALLHVHIHTTTNVWPMVKPGGSNREMLEPENIKGSAA